MNLVRLRQKGLIYRKGVEIDNFEVEHARNSTQSQSDSDIIRKATYYDQKYIWQDLYKKSKQDRKFYDLMPLILEPDNIMLAYRNIKTNKGANTPGLDKKTIKDIANMGMDKFTKLVQKGLNDYKPVPTRTQLIPKKEAGKYRKLGIPTAIDKVIEQAIRQIIEPIFEAKFSENSFGFRPERAQEEAIAKCNMMILQGYCYVTDIDIKSYFDNVDHSILIKTLWTNGIRDKRLITLIKKILKRPEQDGEPRKLGVPQGGVLSPLLANIYLNELDKWIESQWQKFPEILLTKPKKQLNKVKSKCRDVKMIQGWKVVTETGAIKYCKTKQERDRQIILDAQEWTPCTFYMRRSLTKRNSSNLKRGHIIRFADDFKIFCRNKQEATKWFYAIKKWLKKRLRLEINQEKSGIQNLKKKPTHFLGFDIKARKDSKNKRYCSLVSIGQREKDKIAEKIRNSWVSLKKNKGYADILKKVAYLTSYVRGIRNYFAKAHTAYQNFREIDYRTNKVRTKVGKLSPKTMKLVEKAFDLLKSELNQKTQTKKKDATKSYKSNNTTKSCKSKNVIKSCKSNKGKLATTIRFIIPKYQSSSDTYFKSSKNEIYRDDLKNLRYKLRTWGKWLIVEKADLMLSKYTCQRGIDPITGLQLDIYNLECHRIVPGERGGKYKFNNCVLLDKTVHQIIHNPKLDKVKNFIKAYKLNKKRRRKLILFWCAANWLLIPKRSIRH